MDGRLNGLVKNRGRAQIKTCPGMGLRFIGSNSFWCRWNAHENQLELMNLRPIPGHVLIASRLPFFINPFKRPSIQTGIGHLIALKFLSLAGTDRYRAEIQYDF